MARYAEEKMSGVQKAAILLIALGPERSSNIFKHLKEEEIDNMQLRTYGAQASSPAIAINPIVNMSPFGTRI